MEWIGPTVLKNQPVRDFRRSFPWLYSPVKTFLLNTYCTITFMLWRILVVKIAPIGRVTVLLQPSKVDCFTTYYFHWQLFFLFSSHTLWPQEWACSLSINLFSIFVFLVSQSCLTRFQWNWYYLLPYAYSTSTAIFRIILSLSIIPEHTLHSRVKDSITHNSIVIWSSNFNGRLIC